MDCIASYWLYQASLAGSIAEGCDVIPKSCFYPPFCYFWSDCHLFDLDVAFSGLLVWWEWSWNLAQPELVEKLHHVQMLLIGLGGMCNSCSLSGILATVRRIASYWLYQNWLRAALQRGPPPGSWATSLLPLPCCPLHPFPLPWPLLLGLVTVH